MREKAVKVPGLEPEQRKALGRTERSKLQKGLPGRWLIEPGRSGRHALKCRICNHPDRPAIEFDFLNWRNPADLARSYHLRDLTTIYRHAHATGLFAKRRLNLRFAMERIVERVNEVPVTATAVIRAARAITRINDEGQWVDPPAHLVIHRAESPEISAQEPHTQRKAGTETHARPAPIFDDALLDEPLPSAAAAGEMPRIDGKLAPPEVILEFTPEFARCREERRRALEANRQARAAAPSTTHIGQGTVSTVPSQAGPSGDLSPEVSPPVPSAPSVGALLAAPAPAQQASGQGTASAVPSPTPQKDQSVASSPSLLPQAAPENSAPPALSSSSARQNQQPFRSQAGSSGSAGPPFPFGPEPARRWKPRRRF